MMKNNGKLTISRPTYGCGKRAISITVTDSLSSAKFLEIEIGLAEFTEVLTGMSETECKITTRALDKVGKLKETKRIEFPMPECSYSERVNVAEAQAKIAAGEGWTASSYFGSKDSFFEKDGEKFARTTASRWIDQSSTARE